MEDPLAVIRNFITNNLFMNDDFLVIRLKDQENHFFCIKLSPANENNTRSFLFEKYTCEDVKTLNDFVSSTIEYDDELEALKNYQILVVQLKKDDIDPIVIYP